MIANRKGAPPAVHTLSRCGRDYASLDGLDGELEKQTPRLFSRGEQLCRPRQCSMNVAVVAMWVMQPTINQIIDVVAVRYGLMTAAISMSVTLAVGS